MFKLRLFFGRRLAVLVLVGGRPFDAMRQFLFFWKGFIWFKGGVLWRILLAEKQ